MYTYVDKDELITFVSHLLPDPGFLKDFYSASALLVMQTTVITTG